jgi:hypothetical protein
MALMDLTKPIDCQIMESLENVKKDLDVHTWWGGLMLFFVYTTKVGSWTPLGDHSPHFEDKMIKVAKDPPCRCGC